METLKIIDGVLGLTPVKWGMAVALSLILVIGAPYLVYKEFQISHLKASLSESKGILAAQNAAAIQKKKEYDEAVLRLKETEKQADSDREAANRRIRELKNRPAPADCPGAMNWLVEELQK